MTDPTDGRAGRRRGRRREPDWYLAGGDRHTLKHAGRQSGQTWFARLSPSLSSPAIGLRGKERRRREFNVVIFYKHKPRRQRGNRSPKGRETKPPPESGKYWLHPCYKRPREC